MLRGAKLVRVAEDIGGKLSFHDCTLLLTRRGRAPYLVGCVAQIVAARRVVRAAGSRARTRPLVVNYFRWWGPVTFWIRGLQVSLTKTKDKVFRSGRLNLYTPGPLQDLPVPGHTRVS